MVIGRGSSVTRENETVSNNSSGISTTAVMYLNDLTRSNPSATTACYVIRLGLYAHGGYIRNLLGEAFLFDDAILSRSFSYTVVMRSLIVYVHQELFVLTRTCTSF